MPLCSVYPLTASPCHVPRGASAQATAPLHTTPRHSVNRRDGLGHVTDNFFWRQSTSMVYLELKRPEGTIARDLKASILVCEWLSAVECQCASGRVWCVL